MGDANAANFRYLNHFFETNLAQSVREYDRGAAPQPGHPVGEHDRRRLARRGLLRRHRRDPQRAQREGAAAATPRSGTQTTSTCWACRSSTARARRADWGSDPDALQPGTFGPGNMPQPVPARLRDQLERLATGCRTPSSRSRASRGSSATSAPRARCAPGWGCGWSAAAGRRFTPARRSRTRSSTTASTRASCSATRWWRMCKRTRRCRHGGRRRERGLPGARALEPARRPRQPRAPCCSAASRRKALAAPGGAARRHRRRACSASRSTRSDPVNTPRGLNTDSPAVRAGAGRRGQGAARPAASRSTPACASTSTSCAAASASRSTAAPARSASSTRSPRRSRGREGFPDVVHGSSFVMAAHLNGRRCPESRSILTYSQSANPRSPLLRRPDPPVLAQALGGHALLRRGDPARPRAARDRAGLRGRAGLPRRVGCAGARARVRIGLRRRLRMRATVSVYRGKRRLARLRRSRSFTWRRRLPAGRYVARFTIRSATGQARPPRGPLPRAGGRVKRTGPVRRAGGCRR